MTLIVCGLADVETLVAARRPSHMITLLDPVTLGSIPDFDVGRRLRLGLNDVNEPMEGMIPPDEASVAQILAFGRGWDEREPMLVHCWAGISRSTATAFVLACEKSPEADELEIALALRRAAPHALPNRRIVGYADRLLGREGRMVEALDAMGDYDATLAQPFDFPARHA
jgi:predicted protein tyrosine phosphatase